MFEPPRTSEPPQTTALQGLQGVQGVKGTGSRRFDEVRCAVLSSYTTLEMKPPPNKPFRTLATSVLLFLATVR